MKHFLALLLIPLFCHNAIAQVSCGTLSTPVACGAGLFLHANGDVTDPITLHYPTGDTCSTFTKAWNSGLATQSIFIPTRTVSEMEALMDSIVDINTSYHPDMVIRPISYDPTTYPDPWGTSFLPNVVGYIPNTPTMRMCCGITNSNPFADPSYLPGITSNDIRNFFSLHGGAAPADPHQVYGLVATLPAIPSSTALNWPAGSCIAPLSTSVILGVPAPTFDPTNLAMQVPLIPHQSTSAPPPRSAPPQSVAQNPVILPDTTIASGCSFDCGGGGGGNGAGEAGGGGGGDD